jgi:hypothetical protein
MKTILLLAGVAWLALPGLSKAQIIYPGDYDFQSPTLASGTFEIGPTGTPWTFSALYSDPGTTSPNEAGIAGSGSQNLQSAPGNQAGYLQGISSISQEVTLPMAATVSLTFDLEGRSSGSYTDSQGQYVTTSQDEITVSLGGVVLYDGTPTNTTSFQTITSNSIDLLAGSYQLSINGITSGATAFSDSLSFVDNVQINVPEPTTSWLMIIGGLMLFAFRKKAKGFLS